MIFYLNTKGTKNFRLFCVFRVQIKIEKIGNYCQFKQQSCVIKYNFLG